MMTLLREKTALILWFVIAAFIGLIVIEWGADYSSSSKASVGDAVGVVNGVKIPLKEFQNALRNAARQKSPAERQNEGELVNQVWQGFVQDVVLGQEMDKLGVQVSDEEIAYYARTQPPPAVRQIPAFQTDGEFDQRKYTQFVSDPASHNDPNNRAFIMQVESIITDQLRNYKLQRLVMETVHVPPTAVREYYEDQNGKVAVEYLFAPAAPAGPTAEAEFPEAELQAYYQEHQEAYRHPEQVRLEYVLFPKVASAEDSADVADEISRLREEVEAGADFAELAESVSEDKASAENGGELPAFGRGHMVPAFEQAAFALGPGQVSQPVQTRYGWHLIKLEERLQEGDQEKLRARHILLRFKPSRDTEEALQERVEAFQAQAVAQGFRQTAEQAGLEVHEAGYLPRGGLVPSLGAGTTWVVNMLFESQPGEIARPAENEDAMWVAQLVDKRPEGVAPLADVREQVEREVRNGKAAALAAERLEGVVARVKAGASLAEAGREVQLEVQKTEPFSRSASVPGVGRQNAFTTAAFALQEPGQVSDVVTVSPRGAYVIRLLQKTPADAARFESEREQAAAQLLQKRQEEVLQNYFAALFDGAQIEDYRHHFYTF
ncbi:MAG: peptidylprolyl isomerase [Candidatus Latescibacterota bacterium]